MVQSWRGSSAILMPDSVRAAQRYLNIRSLERGLPLAILKKPGSPGLVRWVSNLARPKKTKE